jgi:XTP/dITP diphosphohydrolase
MQIMTTLIIASNNAGKVAEFKQLLQPFGYDVMSQTEAGICISVNETGDTFEENARLKALAIVEQCTLRGIEAAVLADDSGLCVDALAGCPGVYSANYNTQWLLEQMRDVPENERTARFVCCICYIEGIRGFGEKIIRGQCEGTIGFEERGTGGFGYDPVFLFTTEQGVISFAELSADEKNAVSHRGIALRRLAEELNR